MECKTITSLQEIFKNGYGNLMSSAITQPEDIAQANDSEGIKQARALFEGSNEKVAAIYAKGRHRQWAKTVRELALGGKELYFEAVGDSERLSKIVVVLKVNELLYDTIAYVVKNDSAAEHFLLGTDSVSDRDGMRALLGLIKGCVPPGVRQTLQEEHSQLRYCTTRVEKIEAAIKFQRLGASTQPPKNRRGKGLAGFRACASPTPPVGFYRHAMKALHLCHRCGREGVGNKYHGWKECPYGGKGAAGGTAAYCMPADGEGAAEDMHTLALCHIFQVAADDEAVESDGIDVSAYGFSVPGSSGLLTELEGLTSQVKAMEAKVGVYLSQVSLLGDDDVGDAAHGGGASAGGVPAAGFHYGVPTEEFPGGIDLVPTTGTKYWRPEGYYDSDHNPGHGWTWYPGSSYPLVVVPDWTPPSPGGAPPSPDYEPEEVE
ncbi:hypothetical protein CYMTET_41292 [Cymbomonas tetramitiformis]|uniref:Uncharacterized protein n=1 Tax=Cymbomonas tetramitiformis TaxID=36881 RepID=A0AAE0C6G4_9CHLO|nr:hypothetical protein CYMTET_41292 [Cymbomonas tetramitiformis]